MALRVKQDKLKTIMRAKRLTKEKMAKDLGVSRVYLQKIMNKDIPVGTKLIEGLLKTTGYKFEELFYFDQNHTHSKFNFTGNVPENPESIV